MTEAQSYLSEHRPRQHGALPLLVAVTRELIKHGGAEQVRSLFYLAGTRIAADHPLEDVGRLGELEQAARGILARNDWGWLEVEIREEAMEFVHGGAPLEAWFGAEAIEWAPAFFEGLYATWLMQLGADERLQLRQVQLPDEPAGVLRFRLMHESHFPH